MTAERTGMFWRMILPGLLLCLLLADVTGTWAQDKPRGGAAGRSMDLRAYCRKIYGDSTDVVNIRGEGNSWRCTVGTRQYPIDMDDVCKLQYDESYYARLANPADSYTWSCNGGKAPSDAGALRAP